MKYSNIFLVLVTISLHASAPTILLLSKLKGKIIYLQETEKSLDIQGIDYKTIITKEPCNKMVLSNLHKEIKDLGGKSLTVKDSNAHSVNIFKETKNISPQSPLGKYLLNFDQKMITLKSEANLACQKK